MVGALSEDLDINSIELRSKDIYNIINKDHDDLSKYSTHCESISWPKNGEEAKVICKKYLRYLDTSNILNIQNATYDICILLNYWIYEKLNEIFPDEESSDKIDIAFGNFQHIWNELYNYSGNTTHNKCKPDFNLVKHSDWEKRKELYEYYIDYPTFNGLILFDQSKCKAYYEYIKKKEELYEHFEKESLSSGYDRPEFYIRSKEYIPEKVLPDLICHNQILADKAAAAKLSPKGYTLDDQEAEPGLGPRGDSLGFSRPSADTLNPKSTPETSGFGTKVSHTVLGAAPVLLTATMLYRIRRLGGGRTNSMNTMDTFSPYTPETGDMFSDESANYISYQPM
ncbi:PIR protein [Plasmodium vivax]|uniref:VIR protein n=1 Tax=Plasmodium vivax TaxID=5855 RepID=A0A564ZQL5_PLAVI|nr:PIR protein [Plasmodium vivax]